MLLWLASDAVHAGDEAIPRLSHLAKPLLAQAKG